MSPWLIRKKKIKLNTDCIYVGLYGALGAEWRAVCALNVLFCLFVCLFTSHRKQKKAEILHVNRYKLTVVIVVVFRLDTSSKLICFLQPVFFLCVVDHLVQSVVQSRGFFFRFHVGRPPLWVFHFWHHTACLCAPNTQPPHSPFFFISLTSDIWSSFASLPVSLCPCHIVLHPTKLLCVFVLCFFLFFCFFLKIIFLLFVSRSWRL